MAEYRYPGPICSTKGPIETDEGTMVRRASMPPGPIHGDPFSDLSDAETDDDTDVKTDVDKDVDKDDDKEGDKEGEATKHLPDDTRSE